MLNGMDDTQAIEGFLAWWCYLHLGEILDRMDGGEAEQDGPARRFCRYLNDRLSPDR